MFTSLSIFHRLRGTFFLNLLGITVGIAGFVLASLYTHSETGYDRWNPDHPNIYLLRVSGKGNDSRYTPHDLAGAIRQKFPEVTEAGRIAEVPYPLPVTSGNQQLLLRNWLVADKSIASIFRVEAYGLSVTDQFYSDLNLISASVVGDFLPGSSPRVILPPAVCARHQPVTAPIHGIAKQRARSYLNFDVISFTSDPEAKNSTGALAFQTFIKVKSGVDMQRLATQITELYRGLPSRALEIQSSGDEVISPDPLDSLHLRPDYLKDTGYFFTRALAVISGLLLLFMPFAFTRRLTHAAHRKIREERLASRTGPERLRTAVQFTLGWLAQCLFAALLAWGLLGLYGNYLRDALALNPSFLEELLSVKLLLIAAGSFPIAASVLYPAILLCRGACDRSLAGIREIRSDRYCLYLSVVQFGIVALGIAWLLSRAQVHPPATPEKQELVKFADGGVLLQSACSALKFRTG